MFNCEQKRIDRNIRAGGSECRCENEPSYSRFENGRWEKEPPRDDKADVPDRIGNQVNQT
jgi:hypothetical protein